MSVIKKTFFSVIFFLGLFVNGLFSDSPFEFLPSLDENLYSDQVALLLDNFPVIIKDASLRSYFIGCIKQFDESRISDELLKKYDDFLAEFLNEIDSFVCVNVELRFCRTFGCYCKGSFLPSVLKKKLLRCSNIELYKKLILKKYGDISQKNWDDLYEEENFVFYGKLVEYLESIKL